MDRSDKALTHRIKMKCALIIDGEDRAEQLKGIIKICEEELEELEKDKQESGGRVLIDFSNIYK